MKQLLLHSDFKSTKKSFGGELLNGKRKSTRPISTKLPLHLVLRSNASIKWSFMQEFKFIECVIERFAKRFGLVIYEQAINTNHLHLVVQFKNREVYSSFVRAVAGVLAKKLEIKWLSRPFTRIVLWGKDFLRAKKYVIQNQLEAWGVTAYVPRKTRGPPQLKNAPLIHAI